MVWDKQNNLYEESIEIFSRIEIEMNYKIDGESNTFEINCEVIKGHPILDLRITRGLDKNETIEFISLYQNSDNTRISAVISFTADNVGTYYCQAVNDFQESSTFAIINY